MQFLTSLLSRLRSLLGLILPVFAKAGEYRGAFARLRWVVHVVLIAAILVGLYFLNEFLRVGTLIKNPSWMRPIWLPTFFLLIYLTAWLGWWVWKLLLPGDDLSDFPDIDQAWDEAVQALREQGLGLADAPLFIVLGRPARGEQGLFQAANLSLLVKGAPPRRDAPLHIYANADGIYVTCAGASLLGRQAAILAGEVAPAAPSGAEVAEASMSMDKTLRPGEGPGPVQEIQEILHRARQQGRGPDRLTPEEREEIRRLERRDKPRPSLLKNVAEADELTARLQHLCRLIVRDRRPYCPVNGVLLLIPFTSTDSDDDATQTGDICRRDLATLRSVFRIHCPLLVLVCDVENASGFAEFLEHFTDKQRQQRLGQRFPHVPDVPAETLPAKIDDMVGWLCHAFLPNWVYRYFRLEVPGKEELATVVKKNARLVGFLNEMRTRKGRLSRILTRALPLESPGPLLFGGCYLAATGTDAAHEQAFVQGVFSRLVKEQGVLCWTEEALADDAACRRWTTWGYALLALLVLLAVGLAALGGYQLFGSGRGRS